MTRDTDARGFAWKSFWAAMALLFVFSSSAWGQIRQVTPEIRVSTAIKFDVSPAMRTLDASDIAPIQKDQYEIPNKTLPQRFNKTRSIGQDPIWQNQQGAMPGPQSLQRDFDGLGNADNAEFAGGRIAPPDPNMDVGNDYVMQMINLVWTVYNKDGTMAMDPLPNNALWDGFGGLCESNNNGDPITLYDDEAERWVTSQFAIDGVNSLECVAVSVTSDPTGEWYRYAFPMDGFNDYPKLGIGADAYYYTHNDFGSGSGFAGAVAGAFERDAMLNGDPDAELVLFGPDPSRISLLPADIDGTLPAPGTPHVFAELLQDQIKFYEMEVDWTNVENSTFGEATTLNVTPFSQMCPTAFRQACVPQPSGEDLATLGDRLMHRLQYRDMGGYDALVASHTVDATGNDLAGVRWYEFRNDGSGWSVYQQGTYAPDDGHHRWMPSIAMGPNGTIAVGYSVSSETLNPSIRFTARPPGAPLGEMTFEEETIIEGTGVQTQTVRWGDYSAMVVDPSDGSFWYQNEYTVDETGFGKWDTHIGNFAFDPDDDTAPDAIADLAGSAQANTIDLTWTAPADDAGDAGSGPVISYDIRYSTSGAIENETDFENATPVSGAPSPSDPGTTENFTATDLDFSTQYWFAIRAVDDNGNTSLSNSPSATTDEAPVLAFTPDELSTTIEPNQTADELLTITNDGPATSTLEFRFPGFAAQNLLEQPGIEKNNVSPIGVNTDHAKGEDNLSGIGHPIKLGAGGPDEFGYEWIDSNEPGGPTFDWVDISGDGTEVTLGDDDGTTIPLPFEFEFYGETKTDISISSNGYLTFGGDDSDLSNDEIPNSGEPNDLIALYWDDLDPGNSDGGGGSIYHYHDSDNNRFIIQYDAVPHFPDGNGEASTFQAILNADGTIKLQYLDMTDDASLPNSHTIGIEDASGSDGLQVVFDAAYVENELAIEIAATPDFLADVEPASGFIDGGQSQDVTVTFDSDSIEPGTYEKDLVLTSNDPNALSNAIPATLNVESGPPAIVLDPESLGYGEVLDGGSSTQSFTIINDGGGPLEVSSISSDNADYTVSDSGPFTVPFNGSRTIDVTFTPDGVGVSNGTITVASDDPDTPEATVEVTGEGVPAPVIAVDPTELTEELVIGGTAEQTLTVSNSGGSDLNFDAAFEPSNAPDGSSLDRSEVVAPSQPTGNGDASAFGSATPSGQSQSTSFAPEDAIYQLDDGTSENSIGLTNGGDVMWLNAFEVVEGAGAVTEISSAFGWSDGSGLPEGAPVTYLVYEDPNDDGDPTDAELLASVETTVQDPHTDTFVPESIAPTTVEGTFFIAALFQNQPAGQFPAPIDESSGSQQASWVIGNTSPGGFDVENLGNNDVAPALLDDIGFPGNWLLRADGGATFVTVNPASGTVAPGESLDLTVNFDASGLDVDTYTGDIAFSSNDPANSPLLVPTTLEVTSAPYPFALSPESHEVTIDVNEDEDEVETRSVTIENTTDSEQSFSIESRGASGEAPQMGGTLDKEALTRIDQALQQHARQQQQAPRKRANMLKADYKSAELKSPDKMLDLMGPFAPVGVSGYGPSVSFNGAFDGQFVSFDLGEPSSLQGFGPLPEDALFAGDFLLGDEDTFYAIDNASRAFLAVDAETGDATQVGTTTPSSSEETWTEMATDPTDGTVYASTGTNLYTINPETGEATLIGPFNTPEGETMIAIAVDTDGNIYGHGIDLSTAPDKLFSIDPQTGQASLIGSTGVDAFFAQGMDYDPDTGQLYMAWYQGGGVGGLRTVDPETGNSELVGPFQGDELGFMAIPSAGFLFIENDLLAGTLAPGGSVTIDVDIDASGLIAGIYDAELAVIADVPGNPEDAVPFTLEVIADPMASVAPDSLDYPDTFVNDTASQEVTLTNTGRDVLDVSSLSVPEGFSVDADAPFSLEPGASRALTVSFMPTAVQEYTGTLSIESNATNSPSTVELSGTGIEAPVASWDPESFEVQAYPGQQYERTLTLSNTGGNPLEYTISEEVADFPLPEPSAIFEITLLEEDFEDGTLPDGWDRTQNEGADGWEIGDDLSSFFFSIPDNTIYTASNDDECNCDSAEDYIITRSMDFSDVTSATLEFDSFYNGDFSQLAFVEVSTDGGQTFEVVEQLDPADEWVRRTVDLSGYAGESDVRVAFHADDAGVWASGWAVDDVVVKQPIEFLAVNPTEGTVAPGSSQEITYSLNATGLPAGTYQVDYTFSTNDPLNPTKTIPFTIDVIESLSVTPEPIVGEDEVIHPNEEFSVPIDVQSLNDLAVESYEFTLNFDGTLLEATGVTTEGTLSEGLTLATNISNGSVQVAAADDSGNSPDLFTIEGGGDLIILEMKAKEALGSTDLVFGNMQFNEGEPPASTNEATVEIVPLWGDITLNLEVSAFDASQALQHSVGMIDLTQNEAAFEAGDVTNNDELSAFDASKILQYSAGLIDCFPGVEDCEADQPATVAKQTSASQVSQPASGVIAWGAPSDAPTSAKGDMPVTQLPLMLEGADGAVRSIQVTSSIDPSMVSVESVSADLPDDWQVAHHVADDGTFKIAMAGNTPLEGQQKVATVELRWKNEDADVSVAGQAAINEAKPQAMAAAAVTTIPDKFALHGNYPNPFGQATQIALDLPKTAKVHVEVYDVLGRQVLRTSVTTMQAGKDRTVQLDASRLSSGMYLYRVVAEMDGETQVDTGRMTLVK